MAAADVEDMASARQHDGRDGEDEVVVFVADGGADGLVAEDDAAAPGRERVSQRLAVRGVPFVGEHDDGRRTRPARARLGEPSLLATSKEPLERFSWEHAPPACEARYRSKDAADAASTRIDADRLPPRAR